MRGCMKTREITFLRSFLQLCLLLCLAVSFCRADEKGAGGKLKVGVAGAQTPSTTKMTQCGHSGRKAAQIA